MKKHCQQCLANDLERQNLLSLLNSKTTAEIEVLEGELYSVRKAVVEYDVKLKELQVSRDKAISSSTSLLIQIEELKSALKMRDRKIEFL